MSAPAPQFSNDRRAGGNPEAPIEEAPATRAV